MINLIALFIAILFVVAVVLTFVVTGPARNKTLKSVVERFDGSFAIFTFWPTVKGKYQGFEFHIVLVPAGKSSPEKLIVRLLKPSVFTLSVSRETALARLGKKIRLINEIQINDPSFDKEFLIFSNRPVQTVHLLNGSAKSILRELFASGFQTFRIDATSVSLLKPNYTLETDVAPARIEDILQKLLTLSSNAV